MGRRSLLARWKANEGLRAVVLEGASQIPNAARWEEDFEGVPAEAAGEGRH
jgi:hypothetical protein